MPAAYRRLPEVLELSRGLRDQAADLRNTVYRPDWYRALASHDSQQPEELLERFDQLTRDVASMSYALERLQDEAIVPGREPLWDIQARSHWLLDEAFHLRDSASKDDVYPKDAWAELRSLRVRVDEFLEECLDVLQSSPDWTSFSHDPAFLVADALCRELAMVSLSRVQWVLVPGRSELFIPGTRAISIRYPPPSVWELPILAHEMGHTLIASGARRLDIGTFLEGSSARDQISQLWLHELAADVIGALLAGPAYGLAAILTGLDPLEANVGSDTHPPASIRVVAIEQVLRSPDYSTGYHYADELHQFWAELMEEMEISASPTGHSTLEEVTSQLLDWASDSLLPFTYRDIRIKESLDQLDSMLSASKTQLERREKIGIVDVLNAAWQSRLEAREESEIQELNERAMQTCVQIVRDAEGATAPRLARRAITPRD
jgi:hypothetical protein